LSILAPLCDRASSRIIAVTPPARLFALAGSMTESLDQPFGVVARDELADDLPRPGEVPSAIKREALPCERPDQGLDDAIVL
jgi:hypothetical protein